MNKMEEWENFLNQLQESALKKHQSTREYELQKQRQAFLDDLLSNELTTDQKMCIEEIFFEIITFHDREADLLYRQGLSDCIWILKNIGVLA